MEHEALNLPEDFPQGKFANRTLARTVAFQILYQDDLNPSSQEQFAESYIAREMPNHVPLRNFARLLFRGVLENREEIDAAIASAALHWSLSRMNATDRNVLRLATFEMLHTDTPSAVVINEAVEMAKKFGTADSAGFVNGILDRIVKQSQ